MIADRERASLAEERRLQAERAAARAASGTGTGSLADERRITASGTVRQADTRSTQDPGTGSTATSGARPAVEVATDRPTTINTFRAAFNERFEASGGFAVPKQVPQRATTGTTANVAQVDDSKLPPELTQQQSVEGSRVSFLAGTINFQTGSSNLAGTDRAQLKEIGTLYKSFGGHVTVVGHASSRTRDLDPQTRQLANFNVSLERANAVAAALMRHGVPADKVQVIAMADNEPVSHEYMPAGERDNQRAEVYIEY